MTEYERLEAHIAELDAEYARLLGEAKRCAIRFLEMVREDGTELDVREDADNTIVDGKFSLTAAQFQLVMSRGAS